MVSVWNAGRYGDDRHSACDVHVYSELCPAGGHFVCRRSFGTCFSGKESGEYLAVFADGVWNELQRAAAIIGERLWGICFDLHSLYSGDWCAGVLAFGEV